MNSWPTVTVFNVRALIAVVLASLREVVGFRLIDERMMRSRHVIPELNLAVVQIAMYWFTCADIYLNLYKMWSHLKLKPSRISVNLYTVVTPLTIITTPIIMNNFFKNMFLNWCIYRFINNSAPFILINSCIRGLYNWCLYSWFLLGRTYRKENSKWFFFPNWE